MTNHGSGAHEACARRIETGRGVGWRSDERCQRPRQPSRAHRRAGQVGQRGLGMAQRRVLSGGRRPPRPTLRGRAIGGRDCAGAWGFGAAGAAASAPAAAAAHRARVVRNNMAGRRVSQRETKRCLDLPCEQDLSSPLIIYMCT